MATIWETVGAICLFVFVPLHALSIPWYWYRRRHYPINGRAPAPFAILMIMTTPTMAFVGYSSWRHLPTPCWIAWWVIGKLLLYHTLSLLQYSQ
jgi:hypothetical protein